MAFGLHYDIGNRKHEFTLKELKTFMKTYRNNIKKYGNQIVIIRFSAFNDKNEKFESYLDMVGPEKDDMSHPETIDVYIENLPEQIGGACSYVEVEFIRYMGKKVSLEELTMMLLIT